MTLLQTISVLFSLFGSFAPDGSSFSPSAIVGEIAIQVERLADIRQAPSVVERRQPILAGIKPI